MDTASSKHQKKINWKPFIFIDVFFIVLLIIFVVNYKIKTHYLLPVTPENQTVINEQQTKNIINEVGKLMVLPMDEIPTIAQVSDITQLKDQQFFQKAKNGDKVLLFPKDQIAILYDPVIKKIINVGPLNNNTFPQVQATVQPTQAKIALWNGTKTIGLTTAAEKELQQAFPGIDIVQKEQSVGSNYDTTIVIALTSDAQVPAKLLAQHYNVSISSFPNQETKPEGIDILVLLGKDAL